VRVIVDASGAREAVGVLVGEPGRGIKRLSSPAENRCQLLCVRACAIRGRLSRA